MYRLCSPSAQDIRLYLDGRCQSDYSYDEPGCTRGATFAKNGWNVDRCRVLLGHGEAVFARACDALNSWRMFPKAIASVAPIAMPKPDLVVSILYRVRLLPLWIVFPARVVYIVDEEVAGYRRYGFAYGTLPGHPERGEERFLIEWDRPTGAVNYEILAISRPADWVAWIGYPYARWEQARFRRLSGLAMQDAVISKDK